MNDHISDDLLPAATQIASLLSKSEKAVQKVAPDTWQQRMLSDNITALRIASALIAGSDDVDAFTGDDLRAAQTAIADMIRRTEASQGTFDPGTSQHSLQRNRLAALRVADAAVSARLEEDACT